MAYQIQRAGMGSQRHRRDCAQYLRTQNARLKRLLASSILASQLATMSAAAADEPAMQQRIISVDIDRQPLDAALRRLAAAAQVEIGLDPAIAAELAKITAPALHGSYTAEGALRQLLAPSPFTYRIADATHLEIRPARQLADAANPAPGTSPANGATPLSAIQVGGEGEEDAWSPVAGYVAKRSATASKTDTPLIETPRSVTVVTRDQMDAQGAQSLNDALRYTAGVTTDLYGSDTRADWFQIRGFDADLYWNGLRLQQITNRPNGYASFRVEPYTLERIEVLKGPASILYGQGNLGGIVNLVSKQPTETPIHELQLTLGSDDRYQGAFDFGGSLSGDDELTYRFVSLFRMSDTMIDNVTDNRIAISPSIAWKPTEDTKFTLYASYLRDDGGSSSVFLPKARTLDSNQFGRLPHSFNDGDEDFDAFYKHEYSIGYDLDHDLNDSWSLHQDFRYAHLDVDYRKIYGNGLQADGHTLNRIAFVVYPELDTIALDNHAQAKLATGPVDHVAVGGVDYQWKLFKNRQGAALGPTLDLNDPDYHQDIATPPITTSSNQALNQVGFYLQDQAKWDRWVLVLGGRYDLTSARTVNNKTDDTLKQDPGHFTWSAGLLYETDIGVSPYLSASTSFLPTLGVNEDNEALKPTTGQQYEAGIKFQPKGFDSFITASVFQLTQQNVTTSPVGHPEIIKQTGEIRSRGVELEGKASLAEGLDMIAAFTYMDPIITKSDDGTEGNRPEVLPKYQASIWGDYTMPEGDFEGLGLGAGVRYVGSTPTSDDNVDTVPARTLVDAAVHYEFRGIRAQLNVNNIFNKDYIAACSGDSSCSYGTGRTFLGTLRYRW
ncbi:MAG TPA: TonB-dependent siderophore receptor [Terriglobia bacterium]|nr:TonB-dependent siderophore receptor [Terriglobia bacterium]